jgi:two-component system NtrC family response regulator
MERLLPSKFLEDRMDRANLLVIEDDRLQRKLIRENLEREGFTVHDAESGKQALEILNQTTVDVAVVDFKLDGETGIQVIQQLLALNPLITPIMVTAFGNIESAVEAIKTGAFDYIVKPIDFDRLLFVIERAMERQRLQKEITQLRDSLKEKFSSKHFIFSSAKMEEVAFLMAKAAKSEATVLISGETGTGKDFVAKSIHFSSRRGKGKFFPINIASLPETLIESELFGAEKGAFTGAHERKIGKFEAASGGTIFLDEIGDLPSSLQVKLLRVLQEKEFYRLGSTQSLKTDVRIITATNRDLERDVQDGTFRPDLYYRLNVIRIHVPPLRERKDDIPALVDHFVRKYSELEGKAIQSVSAEAMNLLLRYTFPGNIRELENIIERAIVFCDRDIITSADLPVFLKQKREEELSLEGLTLPEKVERLENREIKRALLDNGGVKSKAARALGVTERILSYKIKTYGIAIHDDSQK